MIRAARYKKRAVRRTYLAGLCSIRFHIFVVQPMHELGSHRSRRAPPLLVLASIAALAIVSAASAPHALAASLAPDGAALSVGDGNNVTVYGIAAHWDSLCTCAALKERGFDTRLVTQLAYWHGREHPAERSSLWDVSVTPMLRWVGPQAAARWFVEIGIGVHLLSATRINTERNFSTAFQFGENAATGIAFGERQRYELGVYIQHVSNGGIKEPNDGITYFGLAVRVALP
jgi:hypothetical protein